MKRILFFSTENACRSQMAEAFFIMHSQGDIEVYSAGSNPSGEINPMAVRGMNKRGFDLTGFRSKSLNALPVFEFDYVIIMDSEEETSAVKAANQENWTIPECNNKSVQELAEIRNEIEIRVVDLLNRISKAA